MRNWLIGITLMVVGGALMPAMTMFGCSRPLSVGVGAAAATIGFAIQMYNAFSAKASFEREQKLKQQRHDALMEEAKTLPPELAIQRLLNE